MPVETLAAFGAPGPGRPDAGAVDGIQEGSSGALTFTRFTLARAVFVGTGGLVGPIAWRRSCLSKMLRFCAPSTTGELEPGMTSVYGHVTASGPNGIKAFVLAALERKVRMRIRISGFEFWVLRRRQRSCLREIKLTF